MRRPSGAGQHVLASRLVEPALMFAPAWLLLHELPEYRTGLVIVGPAAASPGC
jgi:ACR3 family arsenite efflux pump ArsB